MTDDIPPVASTWDTQCQAVASRCKAITLANQPNHLLVRCRLEEGHLRDHLPDFSDEDRNS